MTWRLMKPATVDFNLGMGRTSGLCNGGCRAPAVEVVKWATSNRIAAYCKACRIRLVGKTPKERAADKAKQGSLL